MQQLKFILGSVLAAPLMPLVLHQGNKIRREFPRLPEANGPEGISGKNFKAEITVVGIGESSMACVGIDKHADGFIGQFSNRLAELLEKRINWHVYAKSGHTAKMTHDQLIPQIKENHIDLFLIALGGNDTFQLNSPKKWTADIDELINSLRHRFPTTPILFASMPPIHTFPAFTGSIRFVLGNLVRIHGEALNQTIKKHTCVYYDTRKIELKEWLNKLPEAQKEDFYSDGIHPSKLTFEIWGKEMAELIDKEHFKSA